MRKFLSAIMVIALSCSMLRAQDASVPIDSAVRYGVLENGMHYFIKYNNEPQDRASFYFAQNVGSVLEKESQRGLAHFLEHMAFNGTEHFSDKGILEFLEKHGVKFGSEINAFTAFDITVYNISKVPTADEGVLDSVLLVLHDWSGSLSLTDEEIDKERGVINEEWRTRNTANFRASEKIWTSGIMHGSQYESRMPIGLMEVVNNFDYKELRDYYARWYRPDQQAVVIVGDVDVDAMEEKVKSLFSAIPLKDGLPERPTFGVQLGGDVKFIQSEDKELGEPVVEFYVRNKAEKYLGTDYLDNQLIESIASYAFNNRIQEFVREEDCPAQGVSYSFGNFVRPIDILSLRVQPKSGQIMESFQFALTELARFAKYGPTAGELERAKASIKSSYITHLKNKDKISSDRYASEIYTHFFDQSPLPSLEWEVDYVLSKLDEINGAEVQSFMASKFGYENVVIGLKGRDDIDYPAENDFLDVMSNIQGMDLEPYEEEVNDTPLIAELPGPGTVKSTFKIDGVDAKGYVLSNGAKLVLYPTDYDQDKIYLSGFSKGGESLLPVELLPSSLISTAVASESGLGELTKSELDKKLAGTNTMLWLGVDELEENVTGTSTATDIEILFKRLYLSFVSPRFDESAYTRLMERVATNLTAKTRNVKSAFSDSVTVALTNHSDRTVLFNQDLLDNVSFEEAQKVYEDRFGDISDFTFVFVGDFEEDALLTLAKQYIASIASESKTEKYVDHHLEPASGKTLVHVTKQMETPQTTVNVVLEGTMKYSKKSAIEVSMLGQLLNKRYMDVIREQEGGSYGVQAGGSLMSKPSGEFMISVHFDCNPEKANDLVKVVYDEVERLQSEINEADLKEVKESIVKQRTEAETNNQYWLSVITSKLDEDKKIFTLEDYNQLVQSISAKDLKKVAKMINKKANIVEGILTPAE